MSFKCLWDIRQTMESYIMWVGSPKGKFRVCVVETMEVDKMAQKEKYLHLRDEVRKEGKRGHREGTNGKKKPEISRKLVSIKAEKKNHVKMWTTMCPLDFATSKSFSNFGESYFKNTVGQKQRDKLSYQKGTMYKDNFHHNVNGKKGIAAGYSIWENFTEKEGILDNCGTARQKCPNDS